MGAGSSRAGRCHAGLDPVVTLTPYVPGSPPPAVFLDFREQDIRIDENGQYTDMGTIEQQVAISFGYRRGSLKHSPLTGHGLFDVERVVGPELDAAIDRAVRQASPFASLLQQGKVELIRVVTQHPKSTESRLAIEWRKTGDTQTRTTPVGR